MLALIVLSLPLIWSIKVCVPPRRFAQQFSQLCINALVGSFEIEAQNMAAFVTLLDGDEYNYRQHYDTRVESPSRTAQLQSFIMGNALHNEPLLSVSKLVTNPQLAWAIFGNERRYSGVLVRRLPANNIKQVSFYWDDNELFKKIICYALEHQMHLVESWDWLLQYLNVAGFAAARWVVSKVGVKMSAGLLYHLVRRFPNLMSTYLDWVGSDYLFQATNAYLLRFAYSVQLTPAQLRAIERGVRGVSDARLLQLVEWVLCPPSLATQTGYNALLQSLYRLAVLQNNRAAWDILGHVVHICKLFSFSNCAEVVVEYLRLVEVENTCPWMVRMLIGNHANIPSDILIRFPAIFLPYQHLPLPLVRSLWLQDSPLVAWSDQVLPVQLVPVLRSGFQGGTMGLPINLTFSLNNSKMFCNEWFITRFTLLGPSDTVEFLKAMVLAWPYLIFQRQKIRRPLISDDVNVDWATYFHQLINQLGIEQFHLQELWKLAVQTNIMAYFTPFALWQLLECGESVVRSL